MARKFFSRRPDDFDYQSERVCASCANGFHGRYCNLCGEKVVEERERSIIHFLDGLLNAITFLEGKFLLSMKLILTRPGQLSKNIVEGRRVSYMKVLSIFFVANFFYFLFPRYDSFNSHLVTQMEMMWPHSQLATGIVNDYLVEHQMTLEQFKPIYEGTSTNLAKLFIIVIVVWFALCLWLFNLRKNFYFSDHLTFSLELYTFNILFNLMFVAWTFFWLVGITRTIGWDWSVLNTDMVFSTTASVMLVIFLARGQRIFYSDGKFVAIAKGLGLMLFTTLLIQLYRMMLFHLTMFFI